MKKIISACGNDCSICPRHLPKSEAELRKTAELWYKIGYHDRIETAGKISCKGCCEDNWCRYKIAACTAKNGVVNCGKCSQYPCNLLNKCFETTNSFVPACKRICTDKEFDILKKAFFEKKENLEIENMT